MAPDTYEELTDRQRTRVVKRDALDEQAATHASIGNTQALSQTKEGLFDGLSIAQIIAGAAAAATSMVLASKIGIGGSVIGAAASSVITVVSSQLYRRFLDASAEKIKNSKDVLPTPSLGSKPHRVGTPTNFATTTRVLGADDELTTRVIGAVDDATRLMGNADEASTTTAAAAAAQSGTRIAPERLQARAEAERAATQRKVIGFSVLAAIVALVATVGIILALTAGEGLGEKTAPIFAPTTTEDAPAATDTDANANDAQTDGTEQHNATQAGGSSKTDQGNTDANGNASGNQDANDAPSNTQGTHDATGNNTSTGQTDTGTTGNSNTGGATDGTTGSGGATDGASGTGTGTGSNTGTGSSTSTDTTTGGDTGTDGSNSNTTTNTGAGGGQSSAGAGVASTNTPSTNTANATR